jgi:cyanophycinase
MRRRDLSHAVVVAALSACGGGNSSTAGDANATDSASPEDAASVDAAPPTPPAGLTRWLTGNAADKITTSQAGVILMGGGTDVDAAFAWQRDRIGGGDVVVLRASGADGYNDYLYSDIGGVDSVETMIVNTKALALEPYVKWQLDHAEAIFLAGGDQSVYVAAWDDTPVADALAGAFARGAVVGGTSAGCAFLAGYVYSASSGSVLSNEALANPYDARVTLARDVVAIAPLAHVVTDTHFGARDRMGRLLAFTARTVANGWTTAPLGLGVDERTALVVDAAGNGTVLGTGAVYALAPTQAPAQCTNGQPLGWSNVPLYTLRANDTIALPSRSTTAMMRSLSAANGTLTPSNPY